MSDYRKQPQYEVEELLMAVISMFLFKRGSRNAMDNTVGKRNFEKNIEKMFGLALPDLDTADKLMRKLLPQEIELIKQHLVNQLIKRKIFYKLRFLGIYYIVAIDGTGVNSYNKEPYPECPYKTSKNGVRTWTASVLEAKIVCKNGFSISIATEWLKNPVNKEFDKQDCELKAFLRLAKKIKKQYPRLPIVIAADGLYPNKTVFDICKQNNWRFIFTFKDGNLKTIWEEIELLKKIKGNETKKIYLSNSKYNITESYSYINNLDYNKFSLNVVETFIEKKSKKKKDINEYFSHITDFVINRENYKSISLAGRLRWKIENEGFNEQKNGGYNLQHKYSRTSFVASQNYYQCLQIAHMINQLTYKTQKIKEMIKQNDTLKSFIEIAISTIILDDFSKEVLFDVITQSNCQLRY